MAHPGPEVKAGRAECAPGLNSPVPYCAPNFPAKMAGALRASWAALVAAGRNSCEFCYRASAGRNSGEFRYGIFNGKHVHFELTDANGIVALEGLLWPPVSGWGIFCSGMKMRDWERGVSENR